MYQGQFYRILTPPAVEPIYLDEAKTFCRKSLSLTDEDSLFSVLIAAARQEAEAFLRRALVMQTLETVYDCFPPRGPLYLLRPPLMKFTSFEYKDAAGDLQTWAAANYQVDYRSTPARIARAYAQSWPVIRGGEDIHSIVLTYKAGFDVPVSADAATDKLARAGHPFANGDLVRVRNSGGALPGGLTAKVDYYVVGASANDFQLSLTSGGAAVDLTTAGTGLTFAFYAHRAMPETIVQAMLHTIAHWYENREAVVVGTIATNLPHTAKQLLWKHRIMGW